MSIDKSLFIAGVCEKYPEELLEKRVEIEGNCIACLAKDILLLDENNFKKEQWITKDGRFYFELLKHLRSCGINTVDEISILSNCSEKILDAFNSRGAYDSLDQMMSIITLNNWESFCDQLYRENLLLDLYKTGFDLFSEVEINGKKIKPIALFRKMTSEQVVDFYETQLSSFEVGQSSKILEEDDITLSDEWLFSLESGETLGTPFDTAGNDINGETINCFPFLSKQTLGVHDGTLSFMTAFSSTGKSTWLITLMMSQMYYGKNVLLISNEENKSSFESKFMSFILSRYNRYYKLSKSNLESGNFSEEDKRQIKIAQKYWNENFKGKCHFVSMNCTDIKVVAKKAREYVLKKGVNLVIFDTFKLSEDSFSGERTDLAMVRDSRELFNLARKYNIPVIATAQLAERFKGNLFLSAAHIGGAKAIKEICSVLLEMRRVYPDELDSKSKYYIRPFRRKNVNGKWIEEEFEPNPSNSYAVLFAEKNRFGNDSSNGEAYLLQFVGSQSVFKETAFCRPQHGLMQ